MRPAEQLLVAAREAPGQSVYRLIDRLPAKARRRTLVKVTVVVALIVASCTAHPAARGFVLKVIRLPPVVSERVDEETGEIVRTMSGIGVFTTGPAPDFLPAGYVLSPDDRQISRLEVPGSGHATLLWRRAEDGAEIIVASTASKDAIAQYKEDLRFRRRSGAAAPILDNGAVVVELTDDDLPASSNLKGIKWIAAAYLVIVATTAEDMPTMMQIAESIR